jgi:crotonobetainyl-CoA:carnitine CoA-transferase CaiB-like acyl-CoA transferase
MLDALRWLIEMGSATSHTPFDIARVGADTWAVVTTPGDAPTRVRDLGEVFADPSLVRRRMLLQVATRADRPAHVMGSPYPLTLTPPRPGKMIGEVGADLDRVLADWSLPRSDCGATA